MKVCPSLTRAVSCTTRAPRPGERDGVDYYFLDVPSFLARVAAGAFLEHAVVHGHHYGTLKSEALGRVRQGRDVLLPIDVQGAATLRAQATVDEELRRALVTIFLAPPSLAVLEERLKRRGQDSAETIERRLAAAREEVAQWEHFDYLVVSDSIAEDSRRMQVIIEAEKLRPGRALLPEF
jgi:guanylate kinase